jgi:transposase
MHAPSRRNPRRHGRIDCRGESVCGASRLSGCRAETDRPRRHGRIDCHGESVCGASRLSGCRAETDRPRRQYPSDVTDRQWRRIDPLVSRMLQRTGRPPTTDLREVVNALSYRWRTGCVWRMLPHDFPPWGTIYAYAREWARAGVLPRIRETLLRRRWR